MKTISGIGLVEAGRTEKYTTAKEGFKSDIQEDRCAYL